MRHEQIHEGMQTETYRNNDQTRSEGKTQANYTDPDGQMRNR